MKRTVQRIFVITLAALPLHVFAQGVDSIAAWKRTLNGMANLSQSYFDNWTKGGTDALNWEIRFDASAVLDKPGYTWESKGKAAYGQAKLASLAPRKSSDELVLETIYTRKLNEWINPFASARLQSQFAPGYTYDDKLGTRTRVSGVFDPTYVTQTLGAGYDWRKELQLRLGGTLKETFSAVRYGYADKASTAAVETYKIEPGATFTAIYKRGLMENILLSTLLDVFVNFKGADETDVRWENLITAKVNKYISANFALDMLYDKDLSTERQIKENLSIGISFLSI
jgi:hypothetical protein